MPPRYIVHVGPMKTASTYMQQCFAAVQPALEERGVSYAPELIDPGNKHMHMPLYAALVRNQADTLRPVFEKLNAGGYKTVVLSCEHMIFLTTAEMQALRALIGVPQIEIVYVVRRWSDRIASLWSQALFMGSTQTLPEFYLGLLDGRTPEYYPKKLGPQAGHLDIDYSLLWREHEAVFGRDALRLFSYASVMDAKDDVFTRFCRDVVGLDDVPVPKFKGEKRWASMSKQDSEILRTLNSMYVKEHGKTTVGLRNMMMWRRVPIDRDRFDGAMAGETAELVIDDNDVRFDAAYRRMTEFSERMVPGPGIEPGEIFARTKRGNGYVRQDWLVEPGITDALRELYGAMKDAMQKS